MRKATPIEAATLFVYKQSWWIAALVAVLLAVILQAFNMMSVIVDNGTTLSVTGVAVAAFLFTAQSILISISSQNAFIQELRKDGNYLPFIHQFCRRAEVGFVMVFIPMFYMGKVFKSIVLWNIQVSQVFNVIVFSGFLFSLLFTVWAMWLIGQILIIAERHAK